MTREENQLLTETGAGTPCGALLRRYWQPAALSEELPPGGAPLPIRLLGEDLVLFRDDRERPGLLGMRMSEGRVRGIWCIGMSPQIIHTTGSTSLFLAEKHRYPRKGTKS